MDPTIESLKKFDKADEWIVVPNVPMMTPHERTNVDGTTKYKIDLPRLEALAKTMEQIETEDGVLPKIHAGHTVKGGPEPEILGWVRNRRVGKWGPASKDGLLGDFWFHKEKFTKASGLPFRSAEFYPSRNQISAVALLSRDPELDMGMVLCQRDEGCEYYHLREPSMPETPPATPVLVTTAADALPSARSVDEAVRMAREEMAIELKRRDDQIVRLEKEVQAERYHRRTATAEQQVTQLQAEGYIIKNRPALVERLAKMDDETAKGELTVIRENYQRTPLDQPPVRLADKDPAAPERACTREEYERAVSYSTANKVSFEEAYKAIKSQTTPAAK